MEKHHILPTITIALLLVLGVFLIIPNTRNMITGLIIGPQTQNYYLEGKIKITTPVEIYENCSIALELEEENTKKIQTKEVSAKEFKEKSVLTKDEEFFIYTSQLSELTEEFFLEESSYFITIKVFCGKNLISQTQEYFAT